MGYSRSSWLQVAKPPRRSTPLARAAPVLDYLSRTTQHTAIGAERLLAIRRGQALLRVRADDAGGKHTVAVDGVQFIGRFLQRVLPAGFERVGHYGLLAPAAKAERLATARALLAMPQANARAAQDVREFMQRVAAIEIERCPHCRIGRWPCVRNLPADRAALATIAAACPGSP